MKMNGSTIPNLDLPGLGRSWTYTDEEVFPYDILETLRWTARASAKPALDVRSHWSPSFVDGKLIMSHDLPGTRKEDVSITVDGDWVRVEATRQGSGVRAHSEFTLEKRWSRDGVEATLEDGVLRIVFLPEESARPRAVTVR